MVAVLEVSSSGAQSGGAVIGLRNTEFYRPRDDELPWDLLASGSALHDRDALLARLDLSYTRIVCALEPQTLLGIYAMHRVSAEHFELLGVAVQPAYEHQLLGRRLLGHALGLAESKAGREVSLHVCADNARALQMVTRYGFKAQAEESEANGVVKCVFELTPE